MLPLLLVYVAEYTINQGVAPTLLFPLSSSPFDEYRSFYSTYGAIYQVGVFISRSSTPFIRIHHLYFPSFLQVANLVLLTSHGQHSTLCNMRSHYFTNVIPSYVRFPPQFLLSVHHHLLGRTAWRACLCLDVCRDHGQCSQRGPRVQSRSDERQ